MGLSGELTVAFSLDGARWPRRSHCDPGRRAADTREETGDSAARSNKITGNVAGYGGGIHCYGHNSPTILGNTIWGNEAGSRGGGIGCHDLCTATIQGNTISGNHARNGGGIGCYGYSSPTIQRNTISGNSAVTGGGIGCDYYSSPTIVNSIIAFSTSGGGVLADVGCDPSVQYCDVYGNTGGNYVGMPDETGSNGNISMDPLLASDGDCHVRSKGGRWDPVSSSWVIDAAHSPCIDAGTGGPGDEPAPNGGVINMGAYGGTWQASKSKPVLPPPPPAPVMDPEPTYTQGTSNTVSWSAVGEADDYYVEWDTEDSFATPEGNSGWITDTSHTATGLADGQIYYYHVRARNAGGESGWSNTVSSTQDATAPSSQVAALPACTNQTSFEVSWTSDDAGSGVNHVNLYYQYGGGGQYAQFGGDLPEDGSTTFTCPGGEGLYSFYTRATDNAGNVEDAPATPDAETLVDATPPTLSLDSPSPAILWAPNRKAVEVTISGSVVDEGSGVAEAWLEIDDEYGDPYDPMDLTGALADDGSFSVQIDLIASRRGRDRDGRVYEISLHATDVAGNEAEAVSVVVWVPHDRRE